KKPITGIDEDGTGGFFTTVVNDVPLILNRNRRLRVGQVRHQLSIAWGPASLSSGRQRLLHAAAEHQDDGYKGNGAHVRNFSLCCHSSPNSILACCGRTFS